MSKILVLLSNLVLLICLCTWLATLNMGVFIIDMKSDKVPSKDNGVTSSASNKSSATAAGMVMFLYNFFMSIIFYELRICITDCCHNCSAV